MATLMVKFIQSNTPNSQFTVHTPQGTDAAHIHLDTTQTVIWQINSAQSSPAGVVFNEPGPEEFNAAGIEFIATTAAPDVWQQSVPHKVSATEWRVHDAVGEGTFGTFAYRIRVLANGQPFSHDPDLTNTPG